jgi:two-component system, cell cycle response regulator DivK
MNHIPIIALTAQVLGDGEDSLAAGCDEYETKPVDFASLLKKFSLK